MDVRKKLSELLDGCPCESDCEGMIGSCPNRKNGNCNEIFKLSYCAVSKLAQHLISNGVTVQEWISVKDERKPKQLQECLCVCQFDDDAKGEWRFFNVLKWHDVPYQDNGIVNRPHFTDEGVHGMVVTHWMPLPKMPQPPKGE